MTATFRWKLMASYLLLVLLLGAGLYFYLSYSLEQSIIARSREHLLDEVRVASLMASKEIRDLRADAPPLTASLAKAIRARVTVIAGDGIVIADSEVAPAEVGKLESHASRPEVLQARTSGTGSSMRYSATLGTNMMYVAAPFAGGGFIRLALPLAELEQAKRQLRKSIGAALAVAVLAALVLSYILSNVNSRNLRLLAARASRIGRGEFSSRIPVRSSDELGKLAEVINEMTARIEQQVERISSEKNRLDAILAGMGEGVMVTDQHGEVTLVNPAFCSMFATGPEVQGKQLLEITRHADLYDACREVLAERCGRRQELAFGDGQAALVHWSPLLEGETLRGVVAVFHDVTVLKKVERIRRDFVANVSHELRTPVTVIKGYAETLRSSALADDPQRRERFLEIIHNHAERIATLVRDLLTLSELESGEVQMHPQEIQVEGAVKHALLLVEQRAEEKGVVMTFAGPDRTATVRADRSRLDQILINLLDNAVKYSGNGGKVTVEAAVAGEMVRISVRDTGMGIPEKDLPRVFERFYRVDEARSRDKGGTGLGLAIVKHLVQLHGGTVSVESKPDAGAVFSFTLPKGKGAEGPQGP